MNSPPIVAGPGAPPDRLPGRARRAAACLALGFAAVAFGACPSSRSQAPDPAQTLYDQGHWNEALPLLKAKQEKQPSGALLYQIGFCQGMIEGPHSESRRKSWAEAGPILEKELAASGGATLDRLYYLTVISYDQGNEASLRKYGRQAVDQIEKGPDPNSLSGEDWFRFGRIHEFLSETSESQAAYRRAVSAFAKRPAANPSYQALALIRVGDQEFQAHHYKEAVAEYDEALKIAPDLKQVRLFTYGLALLGADRYDDAIAAFGKDREEETVTESQYAADLARKAKEAGGLDTHDLDGAPIAEMPTAGLDPRIREAASQFRDARTKNSWKNGDPLGAEVAHFQKRFVSLLRERLLQEQAMQDFCLQEGIADLVRR